MIKYLIILVLVAALGAGVYWYMSTNIAQPSPIKTEPKNVEYKTDTTPKVSPPSQEKVEEVSDAALDAELGSIDNDLKEIDKAQVEFDAEMKNF